MLSQRGRLNIDKYLLPAGKCQDEKNGAKGKGRLRKCVPLGTVVIRTS
jgi:hypothetical protein